MVIRTVSVCSGTGALDLGWSMFAERFLGESRTVLYVEREAFNAAQLVSRMAEKRLDEAPIWSDFNTIREPKCRDYLERVGVDAIVGGIPCQPYSVAGLKQQSDDPRDLLNTTLRAVETYSPRFVALENVSGFVVPDGLGRLTEGLERLGYDVAAVMLKASDVGASHGRARVFILAYSGVGVGLANPVSGRCGRRCDGCDAGEGERLVPKNQTQGRCGELANPEGLGWNQWEHKPCGCTEEQSESSGGGSILGDAKRFRRGGAEEYENDGSDCETRWGYDITNTGCRSLFAPARNSSEWVGVLGRWPELCPSLPSFEVNADFVQTPSQSLVRRMANGVARAMVMRRHRLRAIGNGVVPLQAAVGFSLCWLAIGGD